MENKSHIVWMETEGNTWTLEFMNEYGSTIRAGSPRPTDRAGVIRFEADQGTMMVIAYRDLAKSLGSVLGTAAAAHTTAGMRGRLLAMRQQVLDSIPEFYGVK